MQFWPADLFTVLATIIGMVVSIWTLCVARAVRRKLLEQRQRFASKVVIDQLVPRIGRAASKLVKALGRSDPEAWSVLAKKLAGLLRALPSEVSENIPRVRGVVEALEKQYSSEEVKKSVFGDAANDVSGIIEELKSAQLMRDLRGDHVQQ